MEFDTTDNAWPYDWQQVIGPFDNKIGVYPVEFDAREVIKKQEFDLDRVHAQLKAAEWDRAILIDENRVVTQQREALLAEISLLKSHNKQFGEMQVQNVGRIVNLQKEVAQFQVHQAHVAHLNAEIAQLHEIAAANAKRIKQLEELRAAETADFAQLAQDYRDISAPLRVNSAPPQINSTPRPRRYTWVHLNPIKEVPEPTQKPTIEVQEPAKEPTIEVQEPVKEPTIEVQEPAKEIVQPFHHLSSLLTQEDVQSLPASQPPHPCLSVPPPTIVGEVKSFETKMRKTRKHNLVTTTLASSRRSSRTRKAAAKVDFIQ